MALLIPQFINSQTYTAKQWRGAMRGLGRLQAGVFAGGEFVVAPVSGMTVSAAAGSAWVDAVSPNIGRYHVTNDAAITNITIGTAHATLPRLDQVCLRVNDIADEGDAANNAEIFVLAGTATSGSDLDDRLGAAALPTGALRLADVLVPAASASVTAANIRDRRPWARGATTRWYLTAADFTTTSLTVVAFSTLKRLELTGKPVRLFMTGGWFHSVTNATSVIAFQATTPGQPSSTFNYPDGRFFDLSSPLSGTVDNMYFEHVWTPAAGSYLFRLVFYTNTAGTLTIRGNSATTTPFFATIVEEPFVSANNGIT